MSLFIRVVVDVDRLCWRLWLWLTKPAYESGYDDGYWQGYTEAAKVAVEARAHQLRQQQEEASALSTHA